MLLAQHQTFADPNLLSAWHTQVAAADSQQQPRLMQQEPALFPRFAAYYTQLHTLPRKLRRGLQRQWKHSLGGLALLLTLGQAPALAATINVGGGCTLVNAITSANTNTATGGCTAGGGVSDTIVSCLPTLPNF